ncbi:MAG: hypothetical protein WBX10_15910, partial [Candidatus Sulfotelmatobacter sp.]
SQRSTPAESDAKIVNRIGTKVGRDMVALVKNLQHPVAQASDFLRAHWTQACRRHGSSRMPQYSYHSIFAGVYYDGQ